MSLTRRAIQLDPLNLSGHYNYATYAYYSGHQEEARVAINKALELKPGGSGFQLLLGLILLAQGKPQEALAAIQQETDHGWQLQGLALAYHALGRHAESDAALTELIANYQFDSAFQIAEVSAYRKDMDLAFEWLERAYTQRDSGLHLVKVDPLMNSLSGDPRYAEFLKKLRLDM
jgi:tetratricopeptide (TPR) repeat protein